MWRHWVGEICGVSSKKEQGGDLVFDDRATKAFMKEDPKWSHVLSGIFLVGMVTTGFLYGMFHWILFILSYSQTLQSCLDTFLKGKCFLLKTLCCIIYELLSFILLLKLNLTSSSYSASHIHVYVKKWSPLIIIFSWLKHFNLMLHNKYTCSLMNN